MSMLRVFGPSRAVLPAGGAQASAAASAALTAQVRLGGSPTALASGGGTLSVPKPLVGGATSAATANADLTTSGGAQTVSFTGAVPDVNFTRGVAASFDIKPYTSGFNPSQHRFLLAADSASLPLGVSLSADGILAYDGSGLQDVGANGVRVAIYTLADADWVIRSTAAGVTYADRFDSLITSPIYPAAPGYYRSGGGSTPLRAVADTSVRCSGAQALRLDCLDSGADQSGYYILPLGQTFGQNSTFYLQYRYRMTSALLQDRGGGGPKMSILHYAFNSCADVEITVQNQFYSGIWRGYTNCGAINWARLVDLPLAANVWWTVYIQAQIGTWGSPNSRLRAWVGQAGAPSLTEVMDTGPSFTIFNAPPQYPGFDRISLTAYDTGVPGTPPANSQAWYDELIVSTQSIAAPAALPLGG